jgi:rhomboid protease GluP
MSLNDVLIWLVYISCASILFYGVRLPSAYRSYMWRWMAVAASVVAVTALMSAMKFPNAGIIGGCLWLLLIVFPLVISKRFNRQVNSQDFAGAIKTSIFLRWLYPNNWQEQIELLRALELAKIGSVAEANAILERYKNVNTTIGRSAIIQLYQMGDRWSEMLDWMQKEIAPNVWQEDGAIAVFYLRALGENHQLNELLLAWHRYSTAIEKIKDPVTKNLGRLFALVFCGEVELVKQILAENLKVLPEYTKEFWLATANYAAGNQVIAREQLSKLCNISDIRIQNAAQRRLSEPIAIASATLTGNSRQILEQINREIAEEDKYSLRDYGKDKKAIATYTIISLNLLAFGLELVFGIGNNLSIINQLIASGNIDLYVFYKLVSAGSTNIYNLYQLGALLPNLVVQGEPWRLVTAIFLHYGWLHLAMNMLALYYLGPFVEFSLGIPRYLLIYFGAGIGSMGVVSAMTLWGYSQSNFVVGASGCIMALIGAMAAILLQGWQQEKSKLAAQRLRTILLIISLQVVFDLNTPQISFIGHFSGVILGFIIGYLLNYKWRSRSK